MESMIGKKINLTGQRFGRLIVLEDSGAKWKCLCDCGNVKDVRSSGLRSGNTKSCGCLHKEQISKLGKSSAINIIGERFGRLVAIKPTDEKSWSQIKWLCCCDCGNKKKLLLLGNCVEDKHHVDV